MYSYGVLLCELLTRIKPYSDRFQVNGYEDILDIVLDCRLIPTIPDWPGEQMKSLIKLCLSHNPDERPSFASIIKELKSISSSQGLSKTSWSTLSKKSKGSKAKSIFEENKDLKLFLLYDIPRMREMLYSESSSSQLMACRELVDLLSKSSEKFHCTYCGSAPFSSAKFLLVDKETVLVFVVRLINLLNGNDELLIESALKALWQILKVSDREALSEYRGILQEDGTLRKILVLLNSTNIQIKDSASKILCLLTNDLGPIDQVKFVDLSFAGLNAISSLSGGIRGLERLNNILEEDVFLLEEKMRDLQNTISRKKQLMKNFEASTSIMETRWRKKNRVLANAPNLKTGRESIYRPRFTKDSAPHFLSSYAAPTLPDPPSNGKCARDKALPVNIQLDENTLKHKEAVYTIEESETFNAIDLNKFLGDSVILSEIQSIHQIPESFIEYFGDHSRIYHSNALRWNEKVEEWEAAYLFLSGDELRVYFTSDDLPEDPLFVIHIDNDNSQFQVVLGSVFSKPFCLKMNSEGDVFNFCFRSSALAYEWASQINPIEFPERSPNSNISLKENAHANSISKSKNVTSLLSHLIAFGDSNECLKVLKESSSMERLKNLPNAFMEYFEGIPISAFGYLLIYEEISNTVDPSLHGNWLTKFCLLANGELRIYDSKENDPEDSESIIYVSGPFVESFQATVNSSGADEWSKRAIALSDDGRVYLICTRSNEEFTLWSSALSAKC